MPRNPQDFINPMMVPYRSEAFAEDLLDFELSLPEPEAHWICRGLRQCEPHASR